MTDPRRCPDYEVCRYDCETDECQRVGLDHPHPRYGKRWTVEDRNGFSVTVPPQRAYVLVELALSEDVDPAQFARDLVLQFDGWDEVYVQALTSGPLPSLADWLPAKAAYDDMKRHRDAAVGEAEYRAANESLRNFGKKLGQIEEALRSELLEALA